MLKEITASIIIVISILILNSRTQAYTSKCIEETTKNLEELRQNLVVKDNENDDLSKKMNELYKQWLENRTKLAYYIEHDELEKVETEMVGIRGNIEVEEYEMAVSELDKCVFILEHIEDKYKFTLDNVF